LRREYDAFVRAMDQLDLMKFETIEVPADLHEKVSARLDKHIYDKKGKSAPLLGGWLRSLSFAGLAAVAIAGAFFALNARGNNPTSNILNVSKDEITYSLTSDGVAIKVIAGSPKTISVLNEGKVLSQSVVGTAKDGEFRTLLTNSQANSSIFTIQISGAPGGTFIALPGTTRSSVGKGEGTVVDLAKAISDFYRMPVKLYAKMPTEQANWSFTSPDAVSESSKAVGQNYTVTQIQGGMLEIDQK